MRVAIPIHEGRLCSHFGQSREFALIEVNLELKTIQSREDKAPPPHEPGALPEWLANEGVSLVIAGGMGGRAQGLFQKGGVEVVTGAPSETPETIVERYLNDQLELGPNTCGH